MLMLLWMGLAVWLARRWMGPWSEAVPLGLGMLQVLVLVGSNAAVRSGFDLNGFFLAFSLLLVGAVLLGGRGRPLSALPADRRVWVLSLLCLFVAWFGQALFHDDDYGAHGALQGQLFRGEFPLTNPWFPEIQVHGHYGRDLLVVVWARLTGLSLLTSQFLLTVLVQATLPWLAYWALYRWNEETETGFWGACFLTLGVRIGGRAGLLDTYQNNNPIAQLYLLLVLYFFVRAWRHQRWWDALALGLVLGGYAVVYESQFGLACLACLSCFLLGLAWSPRPARLVAQGVLVVVVALSLACTQGGPLTDLTTRRISGKRTEKSLSHAAESQEVQLSLKRDRLGQIRSTYDARASAQAVSERAWICRFNRMQDPHQGYNYFWHPSILGLHHFPLWLAPLVLWDTLRRRDALRLWLVAFGVAGFLVPAVVDFGPVFESEWFRWEYAAGLPLAGALGCTLAPRLKARVWVGFFLLFCFSDALRAVIQIPVQGWHGQPLYAGARDFFTTRPQFFCSPDDWDALHRLRQQSQRQDRVLANLPEEMYPNINFSATMVQLTGLHPLGNRKPFENDVVGQWPFHLRADARAFWNCGDIRLLEMRPVQWLYWRPDPDFYPAVPPASIGNVAWQRVGQRWLGRLPQLASWPWNQPASPWQVGVQLSLPEHVRGGQVYRVPYRWQGELPSQGRLLLQVGQDPQDWMVFPLTEREGFLPLAVPQQEGVWAVKMAWVDGQGAHPLPGEARLTVDFPQQLAQMELLSVAAQPDHPRAGQWVRLTSRWKSPVVAAEPHGRIRVALAAIVEGQEPGLTPLLSGTQPGEAAVVPQVSSQHGRFRKVSQEVVELEVWLRLPEAPGNYRVDWFFHPQYAVGVRQRGQLLEVSP